MFQGRLSDIYLWHSDFTLPIPGWPEIEFYIKLYRHCSALYIFIYLFLPVVVLEPLESTTCLQNKNLEFGFYSNQISLFPKFSKMQKTSHGYTKNQNWVFHLVSPSRLIGLVKNGIICSKLPILELILDEKSLF